MIYYLSVHFLLTISIFCLSIYLHINLRRVYDFQHPPTIPQKVLLLLIMYSYSFEYLIIYLTIYLENYLFAYIFINMNIYFENFLLMTCLIRIVTYPSIQKLIDFIIFLRIYLFPLPLISLGVLRTHLFM